MTGRVPSLNDRDGSSRSAPLQHVTSAKAPLAWAESSKKLSLVAGNVGDAAARKLGESDLDCSVLGSLRASSAFVLDARGPRRTTRHARRPRAFRPWRSATAPRTPRMQQARDRHEETSLSRDQGFGDAAGHEARVARSEQSSPS